MLSWARTWFTSKACVYKVCLQECPAGVQVHECGVHVWCLCASSLPLCNRKCRHIKEELVDFVCSRLVVKVPRCNMGP